MNGTLPYSFGVRVHDTDGNEYCSNLLVKGATLPAYKRKIYSTAIDGQSSITLELYKNDSTDDKADMSVCTLLAEVDLSLPEDVTTNDEVEIIYTAGLNGLLIITCKCKGKTVEKTVDL